MFDIRSSGRSRTLSSVVLPKLRLLVLRLDDSLDQMQVDLLLPHRAATAALTEVRERRVAYDFAMHYQSPRRNFCFEVASAPHADLVVKLWKGLTTMSASGTTAWLSALGVKQFETHGASDFECDPKLVVVAEWRDPQALIDNHVDNAVLAALHECATRIYKTGSTPQIRIRQLHRNRPQQKTPDFVQVLIGRLKEICGARRSQAVL